MNVVKKAAFGTAIAVLSGIMLMSSPVVGYTASSSLNPPLSQNKSGEKIFKDDSKEPLERLKKRKEMITQLQKEGKITKEEADKKIAKIDERIKEVEKFNAMTIEQKKQYLKEKAKKSLNKMAEEGKIAKSDIDKMYVQIAQEIDNWDGYGCPIKPRRFRSE